MTNLILLLYIKVSFFLSGGATESSSMVYECRKCPSVFGNSVDLTKHQRSHNHDLSFKQESSYVRSNNNSCTICGMDFHSKEDLMGHMMLVHPASSMPEGLLLDKGTFYKIDEELTSFNTAKVKFFFLILQMLKVAVLVLNNTSLHVA